MYSRERGVIKALHYVFLELVKLMKKYKLKNKIFERLELYNLRIFEKIWENILGKGLIQHETSKL